MRLDAHNEYSHAQAVTATAVSSHVIDHGDNADFTQGKPIPLNIQVVEDFDKLTSLTLEVQQSDMEDFASADVVVSSTLPLADLTTGARFPVRVLPAITKRYSRLRYVVTGTAPTTGQITAGVTSAFA